ncbi:hypothetical protein [Qipengyuania marisflavi]|uniref:Uncharacterized protein n=1 Tax=Qipengyuania marisflavi TaxID=2486356 RepID=A0A5S3P626_9SPHN|nr:hypothetical protein [Qipengyuania marisflavi]TMM48429.1 hypothetical protein FEV51_09155 [Qipengyuania marisflavi]
MLKKLNPAPWATTFISAGWTLVVETAPDIFPKTSPIFLYIGIAGILIGILWIVFDRNSNKEVNMKETEEEKRLRLENPIEALGKSNAVFAAYGKDHVYRDIHIHGVTGEAMYLDVENLDAKRINITMAEQEASQFPPTRQRAKYFSGWSPPKK